MKRRCKFRPNYLSAAILTALALCTVTWKTAAHRAPYSKFYNLLTGYCDTIPQASRKDSANINTNQTDTIPDRDSALRKQRVDTFHLKISKDSLDAPVKYYAQDSAVVLIKEKKILLYGKTKTDYKDITLIAPQVELNQETQVLTAVNKKDSEGVVIEPAHFKQNENEFSSDTIRYNFRSQVGLTKNTFSQQGEMFLHGEIAKKENANIMYIKNARFTTCNLDEPHFAFVTNKMKVINQKLAVSGPAHPEFEGVPIPIPIPFGFYPLSQGRHSGLLPPQFTTNEQYGLGLEGLGYYKVINDHWDAKLYGNIYSYGGWSANLNPSYRKRYHYSGAFNLGILSTKLNFKGDPDYTKTNTYNITWSHVVDSKARPGTSFSANVNAGSTKYNRYIPNNPQQNFQNQLGSSITYSKTWKDKPFNFTLSATHNQNNNTHLINVSLPNGAFTVSTVYPFQKKNSVSIAKWYDKLGIGYSTSFSNTVSFYDTVSYGKNGVKPLLQYLLDTTQWAVHHSIPITVALPPILGGALVISPGVSYGQDWLQRITKYTWDDTAKKVDTATSKGIYIDQHASFSLGFSTALFGMYQFKHSKISAIRHVIRPTFSFSYSPDLNKGHIKEVQVDTTLRKVFYNEIGGGVLFYTNTRRSASLNFQLDNNLEMKVKSKTDTGIALKKVKLIDGFGLSTSYDLMRDSLNLSPINLYAHTTLFDKININTSAILDPYKYDSSGLDINKYAWQGGKFSPGRISNASVSLSTSFKSKPKDAKKEEERKKQVQERLNDPALIADQQRLLDYMQQNPAEFVDFNIPWSVSISYSLNYIQQFRSDFSGFDKRITSNVGFSGSFNLTPKWNFGISGYYDFTTSQLQTFTMNISRDMHCWQMSIGVTPIGLYRFFNFTISPKSSILQDLRINRTRYFTQ